MIDTPIEQRYNKTNRMFHSSGFAIAAGVVAVGAAAGSAAISMSASDKAAKAQGAAGKKYQQGLAAAGGKYEQATKRFNKQQAKLRKEVNAIDPTINIPPYDLQGATVEAIEAANKVTANQLKQLETFGLDRGTLAQAGQLIQQRLSGQPLSQAQIGEIQRQTAMTQGAGYNPATAGRGAIAQRGTFDYARALGTTMADVQTQGFNMAMGWGNFANQFIQAPTQMMAFGLQGRGQDIDVANMNITNRFRKAGAIGELNTQQLGVAQNLYNMQTGQAQQGYGVAQQGIEATLASRQAIAQGVQSIGSATSGALSGMGSAYGQLATAQGASTTPTSSGFYQGQLGAAKAYNVAPSQLSYQQGGGYYYTPSGAYGR